MTKRPMIDHIAQIERENRRLDAAHERAIQQRDEARVQLARMQPLARAALRLYETLNDPVKRQDRLAVREALDGFNEAVEQYQQETQT